MAFIESATKQWDGVRAKGHSLESFMQIFAHTLSEYDQMLSSEIEPKRAKYLLMVKIREALVDMAINDNKKQDE